MSNSIALAITPRPGEILKEIIERLTFDFASALNDQDVESALKFFAEDAVMIAPDRPGVCGKAAIRNLLCRVLDDGHQAVNLIQRSVDQLGDLAVGIGRYSMQVAPPNFGNRFENGKYITGWRHQPDGDFLITVSIWTRDP